MCLGVTVRSLLGAMRALAQSRSQQFHDSVQMFAYICSCTNLVFCISILCAHTEFDQQ